MKVLYGRSRRQGNTWPTVAAAVAAVAAATAPHRPDIHRTETYGQTVYTWANIWANSIYVGKQTGKRIYVTVWPARNVYAYIRVTYIRVYTRTAAYVGFQRSFPEYFSLSR